MNREMNFFSPFVKEKPKSNPKRLIAVIAFILVLFVLIYFAANQFLEQKELEAKLASVESEINSPKIVEGVKRVEEKEKLILTMENVKQILEQAEFEHKNKSTVSDNLINIINAQIPEKAFLRTLDINSDSLTIRGTAANHDAISQFAYNLRQLDKLKDISITNIQNSNQKYDFNLTAKLVFMDEENTEDKEDSNSDSTENKGNDAQIQGQDKEARGENR